MASEAGHESSEVRYLAGLEQVRLYSAALRDPDDPGLNASMRWRLRGDLAHEVLERAWNALAARHEMLRTYFVTEGERLEQVVEAKGLLHVPIVDCSALAMEIVDSEVARIAAVDARAPFDLSRAPLWRLTRLVLSQTDSVLLVTANLLACDGWSFGLIARELGAIAAAYAAGLEPELEVLTTTFGDFANWQQSALTENALAEELDLLSTDFAQNLTIEPVTDFPRPPKWSSRVLTESRKLDLAVTRRFLDEVRAAGSTPFTGMLAIAAIALREHVPSGRLAISTQVVGRDDVDLEGVVGPFVNSMPLTLAFPSAASLSEVMARMSDVLANALELRHVPFARFVERVLPTVGADRGAPFAINFLYQRAFAQDRDYGAFRIESEHSTPAGSQYDLNLYVVERPAGWRLSCDYNPDLFKSETISALLDRFEQTIAGGIDRREPVLFFHSDLFAGGYYAEQVAAAIAERRVIPIGPHGIGARPLLSTIDAMAQDYVADIDAIQPVGPYRLLGFCSGALVAFEVARLLSERGDRVEQLVLINATAPVHAVLPFRDKIIRAVATNSRLRTRVREVICYNIARFNRALLQGPRATVTFIRKLLVSLASGQTTTRTSDGETFVRAAGDAASELSFAHIGAALSHHPHFYDGGVVLVWSQDQINLTGDPSMGWSRLSTSVKVVPMRGGHVAPLHDLVGELSEILQSLLSEERPC